MIINKVPMETSFKWWSSIKSLLKHSYLEVKWEVSLALGKRETWASTIPGDHYQETRLISDFLSLVSIEVENAFENLTLHSLGLWAWSAHIPPASGTHGNHLWHFLKYNENTIIFDKLFAFAVGVKGSRARWSNMTLLPFHGNPRGTAKASYLTKFVSL